ncbi:MAG: hypothetical protein WAU02_01105 [Candidatus Saccharimonadales bacterium]
METSNPKSALVDAIKKSTNILITVAHDPSVDALSAALGFSLMLNKLDKHATAVFSGAVPPAITFLEPEKNFDSNIDSLRDFIIAIDKDKADRLRYKVEGDVVRIYITPYRTNISEKDLVYSQGDFNVDLIIALGVEKQSDLDAAITAHGRILHDATVATVNTNGVKSSIGTLDWGDEKASSMCEMLMSLSEALGSNLLDEQIATALLTGIVSATDRFSNAHTTPRVMTMSAQLMAAGANQQLIAEKLGEGAVSEQFHATDQPPVAAEPEASQPASESKPDDGAMQVHHDDEVASSTPVADEMPVDHKASDTDDRLEAALGHTQPLERFEQLKQELEATTQEQPVDDSVPIPSSDWRDHVHEPPSYKGANEDEPVLGGTLNATTSEAEEAKRAEERSARNHMILSHDAPDTDEPNVPTSDQVADTDAVHRNANTLTKGKTLQPVTMQPINTPAASAPMLPPLQPATPFPVAPTPLPAPTPPVAGGLQYEEAPLPAAPGPKNQTLADLEAEVHAAAQAQQATSSIDDARAAVTNAFGTQPISVGGQPLPAQPLNSAMVTQTAVPVVSDIPLPPPPPLPDFSKLPPPPPELSTLPPSPHPAAPQQFPVPAVPPQPTVPAAAQFQIPGQ